MTLPALVLTAGLGTRLDPITRVVAKPAVPLGDRSLVERILIGLRRQGVTEAVLNLHHRPASITSLVGDGAHLDLSVRYSWEQPVLGSAGGPRRALPLIGAETFLIVNGDTLCEFDLNAMAEAHRASGADATLAVVPNPAPERYNGFVVDGDVVREWRPRGQAAGTWHFVGVQIANASVFAPLADGVPAETVSGIYRELIASAPGHIRAWKIHEPFIDVGTPADYLAASMRFTTPSSSRIDPSARLTRSVVWPDVHVGVNVLLEDAIAIGDVRLPSGFSARSSIVAPASIARGGDPVEIRDGVAIFPIKEL